MNKNMKTLFVLGILICLVGAYIALEGAILGETTANTARVMGITGICLIATQRRAMNNGGE